MYRAWSALWSSRAHMPEAKMTDCPTLLLIRCHRCPSECRGDALGRCVGGSSYIIILQTAGLSNAISYQWTQAIGSAPAGDGLWLDLRNISWIAINIVEYKTVLPPIVAAVVLFIRCHDGRTGGQDFTLFGMGRPARARGRFHFPSFTHRHQPSPSSRAFNSI